MKCISVPPKYLRMGDFQEYYTGAKKAPVLTIFIGGNHEASNYLEELKYGGFVAPNIYYLGRSGVVWYKGLRIAGLSGIYYDRDFMSMRPNVDTPLPYDKWTVRSLYHYRKDDYLKLRLLKPLHGAVMLTHDWPEGIWRYGSLSYLLSKKPFFKKDIQRGNLGSPAAREMLESLKPLYWFAAHLHVGYSVEIDWDRKRKVSNPDEIDIDLDLDLDGELENSTPPPSLPSTTTFSALDKCLPRRDFLQIKEIQPTDPEHPSASGSSLYFDEEYLSVLNSIESHRKEVDQLDYRDVLNPVEGFEKMIRIEAEAAVKAWKENGVSFEVNMDGFVETAEPNSDSLKSYTNPQTVDFIDRFIT